MPVTPSHQPRIERSITFKKIIEAIDELHTVMVDNHQAGKDFDLSHPAAVTICRAIVDSIKHARGKMNPLEHARSIGAESAEASLVVQLVIFGMADAGRIKFEWVPTELDLVPMETIDLSLPVADGAQGRAEGKPLRWSLRASQGCPLSGPFWSKKVTLRCEASQLSRREVANPSEEIFHACNQQNFLNLA